MPWDEFNAETLFPETTKDYLKASGDAAEAVADIADVAVTGLDTVADLLSDIANPAQAVIDNLKKLISDIMETGIFLYWDKPSMPLYKTRAFSYAEMRKAMDIDGEEARRKAAAEAAGEEYTFPQLPLEPGQIYGFTGWRRTWEASFYDEGDKRRPIYSDRAAVSCLLFLAGTPSLDILPTLLKAIGDLFGIDAFKKIFSGIQATTLAEDVLSAEKKIKVVHPERLQVDKEVLINLFSNEFEFVVPKTINNRTGEVTLYDPLKNSHAKGTIVSMTAMTPMTEVASKDPDWISLKVKDIPPMNLLQDQIKRLLGILDVGAGMLSILNKLIAALRAKADDLRALATAIQELITLLEQILSLTGVYIIQLDSTTGVEGLFEQLDTAGPPPLPSNSFIAGVCLLGGGPDLAKVAELFGG